jgi:hypothetical protein
MVHCYARRSKRCRELDRPVAGPRLTLVRIRSLPMTAQPFNQQERAAQKASDCNVRFWPPPALPRVGGCRDAQSGAGSVGRGPAPKRNRLPTFEYTTFSGRRSRSIAMNASPVQCIGTITSGLMRSSCAGGIPSVKCRGEIRRQRHGPSRHWQPSSRF